MFGKAKAVTEIKNKLEVTNAGAEIIFDTVLDVVREAAESDSVRLPGIGVLRKNIIPAHEALNPKTLEKVEVPVRFNYRLSSTTKPVE